MPEANAIELLGIAVSDLAEQKNAGWLSVLISWEGPPRGRVLVILSTGLGSRRRQMNRLIEQYGENLLGELLTVATRIKDFVQV